MKEMAAWHEFQANDSENRRQWSAAAFHLERLLSIRPDDRSLVERLTRARRQIQHDGNWPDRRSGEATRLHNSRQM